MDLVCVCVFRKYVSASKLCILNKSYLILKPHHVWNDVIELHCRGSCYVYIYLTTCFNVLGRIKGIIPKLKFPPTTDLPHALMFIKFTPWKSVSINFSGCSGTTQQQETCTSDSHPLSFHFFMRPAIHKHVTKSVLIRENETQKKGKYMKMRAGVVQSQCSQHEMVSWGGQRLGLWSHRLLCLHDPWQQRDTGAPRADRGLSPSARI